MRNRPSTPRRMRRRRRPRRRAGSTRRHGCRQVAVSRRNRRPLRSSRSEIAPTSSQPRRPVLAIDEIRDYTIDPEYFKGYVEGARKHAVPWLTKNLHVVGFWVHGGEEPVVGGTN